MSGKFQRTYSNVAWRMSGKFQRTYNSVAWRMSGKFQRTCSNVAWRMSGKFQRTYIAWHDAEWKVPENLQRSMSFLRKITWTLLHAPPHPTPPLHTCTYWQPQTRMSFLRKFTWTLLHAPPHPKPAPPHPPDVYKTPRPSKGRGPTSFMAQIELPSCFLQLPNYHVVGNLLVAPWLPLQQEKLVTTIAPKQLPPFATGQPILIFIHPLHPYRWGWNPQVS